MEEAINMGDVAMTFRTGESVHFLLKSLDSSKTGPVIGMICAAVGFCLIYEYFSFLLKKKEKQYVADVREAKSINAKVSYVLLAVMAGSCFVK